VRDQLDRLGLLRVAGQRTMGGTVDPDDLGQQMRVGGIGLRTRGGVPSPITGHRHRIDREHLIPGRDQGGHPRTAVGLDPDLHQALCSPGLQVHPVLGQVGRDQRVQLSDPRDALRHPPPGQHRAGLVDDLDVVVVLGPVITHKQHPDSLRLTLSPQQRGGDSRRSNGQVLTINTMGHDIPAAVTPPHDQRAHGLPKDLQRSDEWSADPPAATRTEPAEAAQQKPLDECDQLARSSISVRVVSEVVSLARVAVDPDSFAWLEESTAAFSEAGCLTLVAGLSATEALHRVGADLSRTTRGPINGARPEGYSMISAVEAGTPVSPSAVLVEDNGYEGAQPDVLVALSRRGRAASAFWNVNGMVMFGCARRGTLVCSTELPGVPEDLPRSLNRLMDSASDEDARLVAIAMAMAATFTGIGIEPQPALVDPHTWYPITAPILQLPITAEELVVIGLPSKALVSQVQDADESSRRRLAEWSARQGLTRVGLEDDPAANELFAQFGHGRATSVVVGLARELVEAERQTDLVGARLQRVYNDRRNPQSALDAVSEESAVWAHRMWALRAVSYLSVEDSVTAALGATYCASHSGADETAFLAEAAAVLARPA
jgi:hypothetical protein